MHPMDLVDHTATETIVCFLSNRFNTRVPEIRWAFAMRRKARYYTDSIRFSAYGHQEAWSIVHEFAHHLHRYRGGTCQNNYHGAEYGKALMDCVTAMGWEMSDYPWTHEYPSLMRFARVRGFLL